MALSRGGRLLGGLVMAGFGVGLALFALEAGVRLLHLVPDRFWRPDAQLGTALIPNAHGWWTQEEHEFVVPVQINAEGRRDLDRGVTKPTDAYRIMLLGDSFVEALQVPIADTFARGLERRLSDTSGRPVEVVSMGVSGYGTASQYLWYRDVGRRYHPDLVLLSFYPGNDVRNNSPTLEPTLRPIYSADGRLERVAGTASDDTQRRGLNRSAAYTYIRKLILTRQPALAARLADLGLLNEKALRPVPLRDGVPVDYWVYAQSPPPDWQDAWTHTEQLLTAFRDQVRADGARFVVMIVTAREQIYPDDWQQVLQTYPAMQSHAWDVNGPERHVLDWCARNGAECVALSPAFVAARDGAPRLHWHFDGHWTAAGHALAAQTMAEFLRPAVSAPAQYAEGK
ncbi:MAG: SGNH/GDSL hydrolase family protein [Deltaproteobacteria bacterium]|nr:SGNH/GDSL hydrolase family protein [Deltaproteobacteria bacterium]